MRRKYKTFISRPQKEITFKLFLSAITVFLISISFFPLSAYSRQSIKHYYEESLGHSSKAKGYFSNAKFAEAYKYYSQAVISAERSMDLENYNSQRQNELKNIIRNAKNQKRRIRNILKDFQTFIREKKISRGMTSEQVIASWGQPKTIERTLVKWSEHETWNYGNILLDNDKYVFFKNSRVIDWEDRTKK
jgi:hypothetical protein